MRDQLFPTNDLLFRSPITDLVWIATVFPLLRKRQLHTLLPLPNDKLCQAPRFWVPRDQLQPGSLSLSLAGAARGETLGTRLFIFFVKTNLLSKISERNLTSNLIIFTKLRLILGLSSFNVDAINEGKNNMVTLQVNCPPSAFSSYDRFSNRKHNRTATESGRSFHMKNIFLKKL